MLTTTLLFSVLLTFVLGSPATRNLRVHESRPTAPAGFSRVGPADPDTVLSLRLGLVSEDTDKLIKALYDVSAPSSSRYGQHLSRSSVRIPRPKRYFVYVLTIYSVGRSSSLAFVWNSFRCERLVDGEQS